MSDRNGFSFPLEKIKENHSAEHGGNYIHACDMCRAIAYIQDCEIIIKANSRIVENKTNEITGLKAKLYDLQTSTA